MPGGVQPVKAVLYVNGKPMAELEEIENIELDERSMQDDYSEKQMINKDETFSFTIENAEFNEKTFWKIIRIGRKAHWIKLYQKMTRHRYHGGISRSKHQWKPNRKGRTVREWLR